MKYIFSKLKREMAFIASRVPYLAAGLFIGLLIAGGTYYARAWTSWTAPVSDGAHFTAAMWNELASRVNNTATFINPVDIYSGSGSQGWTEYNASALIPADATAVILEAEAQSRRLYALSGVRAQAVE